jgi:hypothetical protein
MNSQSPGESATRALMPSTGRDASILARRLSTPGCITSSWRSAVVFEHRIRFASGYELSS